jgi:lysophospholipase L1-like esterase
LPITVGLTASINQPHEPSLFHSCDGIFVARTNPGDGMAWRTAILQLSLTAVVLGAALAAAGYAVREEPVAGSNPAATPAPVDLECLRQQWLEHHEEHVRAARRGGVNVLFLGDSLTEGWRHLVARAAWDRYFKPLRAASFGIGGDRTQHLLWRLAHGELDGTPPRVAVLLIGTNNTREHSAAQVAAGIEAVVGLIRAKAPATRILLLAVVPRGADPNTPVRRQIDEINRAIAKLDDGTHVYYLDIGAKFLQPDGRLTADVMPDFLHLSARGYQIWGEAIAPAVAALARN